MADRHRRRGIQHDFPHDPRNTRKPLATSAPSTDSSEKIAHVYSSSFDDVNQRGRSSVSCNRSNFPSSHHLRPSEVIRVRDSGYNTDVSPARTSSSTSTPAEHFCFDFPERMTIREDSNSAIGSPYSDAYYLSEDLPEHGDDEHQEQQQYSRDTEGQFLQTCHPRSSLFPTSCGSTVSTSTSSATFFPTQPHLQELSDPHYLPHHYDNPEDNDGLVASAQQLEKYNQSFVMSQSAPGSRAYRSDISFGAIGPSSSVPGGFCPEIMINDEIANDDFDTVDGRRDKSSFSHGYKNTSPPADGFVIPLLPKSMSNSFQDLQGGDETDSEEEEENDVMTSSEEREMEEMVQTSKTKRFSLRKRHYSGQEEDECGSSSSIPNTAYAFSGGNDDSNAIESGLSVHVPFSTSSPSLGRDHIDHTSPELASSIKNACKFMVGLSIGSPTEQAEEEDLSERRRRMSREKDLSHSCRGSFFLREEEELFFDNSSNFDTLEDTVDSFDMDDGDEDVFTFDMDDIQEYTGSQESVDKEQYLNSPIDRRLDDNGGHRPRPHQYSAPTTPKAPVAVPSRVVFDRPPISPSSRTGRKTVSKTVTTRQGRSIHAHVQLAGGARLPWDEALGFGGIASSSSTHTPHRTYTRLDEMGGASLAVPNEARGAAFKHLRRGSVDMTTLTGNQPAPLPEMVPFVRDRAQSAPNLHDVILRQRAQKTGRELRRLSDLFHENVVRRHSVHHDENQPHQQSSSYPRMGPSYILREGVRALIFGTFRSRRDSSVDDDSFQEMDNDESSGH